MPCSEASKIRLGYLRTSGSIADLRNPKAGQYGTPWREMPAGYGEKARLSRLFLFALFFHLFFDRHILKLTGFKHFAAFEALDELGVLLTTHDSYARMLTGQGCDPFW